ncbi:MAG TPA: hypothetical protein VI895_04410 [Bdellovibrionota bacterium]|nr:hypothetical protein [Bdellovibrionota bacterium]
MKKFLFVFLLLLAPYSKSFAQNDPPIPYENGSWFVAIEGGYWVILGSGRELVKDAPLVYLTLGFNLLNEFKSEKKDDSLTFGPKIGFGVGEPRATRDVGLFYDLLLKIRYTLGDRESLLRPYIDAGPGLITYNQKAFELEGGAGLDFNFGGSTVGFNAQYKEVIGAGELNRGVALLATLGYRF